MNKIALILSKENQELSEAEAEATLRRFTNVQLITVDKNLMIVTIKNAQNLNKTLDKLAYTKQAFILINEAETPEKLQDKLEKTRLNFINLGKFLRIGKSFKISTIYLTESKQIFDVKAFAKIIYERGIEDVDLKNPSMDFTAINANKSYLGLSFWQNKQKFDERRADKRPFPHPTSMNPKLARAMINLAHPTKEILDPFCGSGGILIEGGMLSLHVEGIDIDPTMVQRATQNLKHYQIKDFQFHTGDATERKKKVECVITDVPYGKSSKLKEELQNLTDRFLNYYLNITNTIVLACPNNIKLNQQNWKIEKKFDMYIHSNLTRTIYLLRKS